MSLQPFAVRDPAPKHLIIEFFGHDNDLHEHQRQQLMGIARGAGPGVSVLAVTDIAFGPARVLEITSGNLKVLQELGEIDTGDAPTLKRLLVRALLSYPGAERIAIGFAGHSTGIFNEAESAPVSLIGRTVLSASRPIASNLKLSTEYSVMIDWTGGRLGNKEAATMIRSAFDEARRATPVDLLFFDGCINGMIEVVAQFRELARCIVASEDDEPPMGWDYAEWLSRMKADPPGDGEAWGRQAVAAMKAAYSGRTDFHPVTLSAVRTGGAELPVVGRFGALVAAAAPFGPEGFAFLAWARRRTEVFHRKQADSFDLLDFARHLAAKRTIEDIAVAADALALEIGAALVDSMVLGPLRAGGLAFWFPGRIESFEKDVDTYSELSFDLQTGWSDYLRQHL